jgi:anti-anti-sigma regulatory factor
MASPDASTLLRTQIAGDRLVVRIGVSSVDFIIRESLAAELSRVVADQKDVTVDLSVVQYIDNLGFESLLMAVKMCPGRVRFANVARGVLSLFTLAHLDFLIEKR